MINKGVFWCCVGIVVGVVASYVLYKSKVAAMGASNLRIVRQAAALSSDLAKVKIDLATCQGSSLAKEASLEGFYQELIFAERIDVVTFGQDGSARRLVFDCAERREQ